MNDEWLAVADAPDFLNRVANHPEVFGWVCGPFTEPLDLTPIVDNPDNFCLIGRWGFSVFAPLADGVYEWHAATLPQGRGRWALQAGREAIDLTFRRLERCCTVLAYVPASNRPARHLVCALGFQRLRVLPTAWPMADRLDDLHIYVLPRVQWGTACQ